MKLFHSVLLLSFMLSFSGTIVAQSNLTLGDEVVIGTSFTYIFDAPGNGFNAGPYYHEFTWNGNIAVLLMPRFYTGLSYKHIWSRGSTREFNAFNRIKNDYYHVGPFVQFSILDQESFGRFYTGVSYNWTNYCTCGFSDPYKKKDLNNVGWTLGGAFDLNPRLQLDLAYEAFYLLGDVEAVKSAYGLYILGVDWVLTKE